MTAPVLDSEIVRRYLAVLGVSRKDPTAESLSEIVAAHLTQIPFENISKLYNRKHHGLTGLPSIHLYLDGIERCHFGGTCYSNNFYLYSLLTALGYEARLCSADMRDPDVHAVIMVAVDGREYLVDGGYSAPLLAPLPRDLATDHVVVLGRDRYVLKPQDTDGCSCLEMYRDGQFKHRYRAKPAPKNIEDFRQVIAHSFRPDATFLNSLLLTRFAPGRGVMIHNLTVAVSHGNESAVRTLGSRDELIAEIEKHFAMPRLIVAEVVGELADLQDPWT